MLNSNLQKLKILLVLATVSTLTAVASASFGADNTTPSFLDPNSRSAETTVGSLPQSNQWLYDRTSAFVYLGYDSLVLNNPTLKFNHFTTDVGAPQFNFISLDSFMRLWSLASPERTSIFGKFAFWGQFSLGFGSRNGSLYDQDIETSLPAETSTLSTLFGKAGLQLVYDYPTWIKPYLGMSMSWYGYMHNSSMSGASAQGSGTFYGPAAGLHLLLGFLGRISIYGEVQKILAQPGDNQIFADSTNFNGGIGFAF